MGRTKGAKNKPKGFPHEVFPAVPPAKVPATAARPAGAVKSSGAGGANPAQDDSANDLLGDLPPEQENQLEFLLRKYERGAKLLGYNLSDVDRLMGESQETFSRRKRWTSTQAPVPPVCVSLYQRLIPLSEEYLRADTVEGPPDDRILDVAAIRDAQTGRAKQVLALEQSLRDAGAQTEAQIMRTIDFVIMLGYFGMEPKEVFDALMEKKTRKAFEEFGRARKALGMGDEEK